VTFFVDVMMMTSLNYVIAIF